MGNQLNPDGSTTAVLDTTTALVLTNNLPALVQAAIDPSDNRRVVLTANPAAPFGGAQSTVIVTVNTNPALPGGPAASITIPITFTPATDKRSLVWDPAQGGIAGDV